MLNITETWFKNIGKRKLNVSVFLDLKKAFDAVDHGILPSKLSALGVIQKTHCWFTSYLRNKEQSCHVALQNASTKSVNCGIPQGSCLGPLLFIIYVNDFKRCFYKGQFQTCTLTIQALLVLLLTAIHSL